LRDKASNTYLDKSGVSSKAIAWQEKAYCGQKKGKSQFYLS